MVSISRAIDPSIKGLASVYFKSKDDNPHFLIRCKEDDREGERERERHSMCT